MSLIAAVFGSRSRVEAAETLSSLTASGIDPHRLGIFGHGGVGASGLGTPEAAGIASKDRISVAADARLLHRSDLASSLRKAGHGADDSSASDAELILQAYLAWGPDCASRLEGDFAFVVWDEDRERGLACADFAAGRTLFHARAGSTTVVASSVDALVGVRAVDAALNLTHIGEITAGLWAGSDETCRSGVRRVMPGHSLIAERTSPPRTVRHWFLPGKTEVSAMPFEDAALELRSRIVDAVGQRLASVSRAAVWLSGGWDSTAVFAAGQEWLRRNDGDRTRLLPVSMSYPPGDPGYEDDLIRAVTDRWSVETRWIDVDSIPVIEDAVDRARERGEPWCHPFQLWNEALADGAAGLEAELVLTGNGGDQIFSSPIAPLADMFWTGRWGALRREWIERRGRGVRSFLRVAVLPGLPREAHQILGGLRGGRRLHQYLDRPISPWIRSDFIASAGLLDRQWDERPWPAPGKASRSEMEFFFSTAYAARISDTINRIAWDRGLSNASPLLDRRVVEFAAARPAEDRSRGMESKRLLRQAMKGLLPEEVLAPRAGKTGLTAGYFERGLRAALDPVLELIGQEMALADLGIVDASEFRSHARAFRDGRGSEHGLGIYLTVHAELWLRTHSSGLSELS